MKTYNEMANDVLCRIEEYETKQRNKRKVMKRAVMPILVPAMCFCLAALIGVGVRQGGLLNPDPVQTQSENNSSATEQLKKIVAAEPFIYLCSVESNENIKSDLIQPNQYYDCKIYLDFLSIKGLTEDQIEQKFNECNTKIKNALSKYSALKFGKQGVGQVLRQEEYIVSKLSLNFFKLKLDDINNVKQIRVTNTSNYGQIDVFGTKENTENYKFPHGKDLTIEKDQISECIGFSWNYDRLNDYLKENLNPSCQDFNDTFNFTVEYTDGSKAIASVDIVFNESGEATISCEDYKKLIPKA